VVPTTTGYSSSEIPVERVRALVLTSKSLVDVPYSIVVSESWQVVSEVDTVQLSSGEFDDGDGAWAADGPDVGMVAGAEVFGEELCESGEADVDVGKPEVAVLSPFGWEPTSAGAPLPFCGELGDSKATTQEEVSLDFPTQHSRLDKEPPRALRNHPGGPEVGDGRVLQDLMSVPSNAISVCQVEAVERMSKNDNLFNVQLVKHADGCHCVSVRVGIGSSNRWHRASIGPTVESKISACDAVDVSLLTRLPAAAPAWYFWTSLCLMKALAVVKYSHHSFVVKTIVRFTQTGPPGAPRTGTNWCKRIPAGTVRASKVPHSALVRSR
jgi:hypothetical protein